MGLRGDWGYAKGMFRHACHNGSIAIVVETGARAGVTALLDFVSFGCRESLKFSAGRGQVGDWFGYGNVRKNPWSHRKPNTTGGKVAAGAVSSAQAAFWYLDARLERGLFYFMLFNIGKDFFLNWQTLMYQENGCDGPFAGRCVFKITDQIIGTNPTEMLIAALPDCHGVLSDIRAWYVPSGIQVSASYHFNSEPWAPAGPGCGGMSSRIVCSSDGKAYGASDNRGPGSPDNGNVGHGDHMGGGLGQQNRYSIVASTGCGLYWCHDGFVHLTLSGRRVPLVPLQDCFKEKKAWNPFA